MATGTTPENTNPPAAQATTAPVTDADVQAALAAPAVATPSASAAPATAPAAQQNVVPVIDVADDGDIPQDAELIRLSRRGLTSRLERHSRKELKERFGTDNPDEIKGKLDRLAEFEAKQEEQRIAQLSEVERERELANRYKAERDEYKNKYRDTVTSHSLNQEQTRVERIAGAHVNERYMRYELPIFAKHLKDNYSKEELRNLSDGDIERYFSKLASDKPELARPAAPAAPAPPPRVAPLTNGPSGNDRPASPGGAYQPVNLSPTAPNALSREAARAEARKLGYDY